jgi:hypothetical protein
MPEDTTQEVTTEAQAAAAQEPEQAHKSLTAEEAQAALSATRKEAADYRRKLREIEAKLAEAEKAKADEAERQAKEQGRFQELYEVEKGKAAEAQAQLQRLQQDAARKDAAQAAGIPQLWERLRGETADEMAEDARQLAAFVTPPPAANGQPARAGTQPTPQAQGMKGLTPDERRAKAARTF